MAKENATDKEIIEVCKKCHIHNFIKGFLTAMTLS